MLLRILDLEDDVAVVDGEMEGDAPRLDRACDRRDAFVFLRPAIDVYLEAHRDAGDSARLGKAREAVDDLGVREFVAVGVIGLEHHVDHLESRSRGISHRYIERAIVASESRDDVAGEHRNPGLLGGCDARREDVRRGHPVDVIEHAGIAHGLKARERRHVHFHREDVIRAAESEIARHILIVRLRAFAIPGCRKQKKRPACADLFSSLTEGAVRPRSSLRWRSSPS